ncbi:hypothetical protein OTU49_009724, partial [Cherax quadricarinatus]
DYTVLHKAVYYNFPDIVDTLISAGANVNLQNMNGFTALILAAREGNTIILNKLLAAGANLNLQEKSGKTALHWATRNHWLDAIKALLKTCPDVTIKDKRGMTPLDVAKATNKSEIISLIEGHNAAGCK